MLDISFITTGTFQISQIPEQWRDYVSVTQITSTSSSQIITSRVSIAVQPDDSSYRYRSLMQPRQLMLKFSLPFFFEFPVGSTVTYENETYFVKYPEDIKKKGERNIDYSMLLYTDDSDLGDYKIRNTVDGRLKWSMCARPHEFIEEIVKNLNQRQNTTKWKVGSCLESTEKTVEFNHTYIDAALADIATVFETEYEITSDCSINLRKVEYNKNEALPLSHGRGNGFVPGVGRTSETGGAPVKRLYVQGGDRNIDRSTYGEMLGLNDKPGDLLLPLSQTIKFDGTHFEGNEDFNDDIAHTYQSDEHGYYIERIDVISQATKDDSLDCSEIYPSRIGKCSGFITVDADKNLYDFVDDSIPANLDFNSYLIAGETMTVIFQTGMLSGNDREFEVKYYHDSVNGKPARRFEIVPQEIDGITMPNETFKPKFGENGDTYAVFGIQLPKEYICNDTDKSGASWDMMREAARKLYDCEEQKFTFTGELQSLWAKRNWESVGGKLVVGGYVWFTDNQFAPTGTPIRIVGIKDFITRPYAPTIELSNSISSPGSVSTSLRQIENTEVVIDDTKRDVMRFTKRRFRDALETIGMLEDAQLANFNSAISPVAIQTMAMLVGDESLQFIMGKTVATLGSGDWSASFANNALTAPAGYLRHMTIGINTITADREKTQYLTWQMPSMNLTPQSGKKYFVYAVVNRSGFSFNETLGATVCNTPGQWLMSESSHRIDENTGKYHLLVGVLNSEYNGERSFASLYGFTEVLPGRMTTDMIVSNDGKTFMNLATGEICGNIKFLSENDKYITIIEGGKLKNDLIDTDTLIAKYIISGDVNGSRIEISPTNKSIEIYDNNNELVSIFEGKRYNAINNILNNVEGTVSFKKRSSLTFGYSSPVELSRGVHNILSSSFKPTVSDINNFILSETFISETPTQVEFIHGNINTYLKAASFVQPKENINLNPYSSWAIINISINVESYSDANLNTKIGSYNLFNKYESIEAIKNGISETGDIIYATNSSNKSTELTSSKVKVPAGYHVITMNVTTSVCGNGSEIKFEWGYTKNPYNDFSIKYNSDFYISRYFANGFCLGNNIENFISAISESEGMSFEVRSNGNGIKINSDGLKFRNYNQSWYKDKQLLYHAHYINNSTKYDIDNTSNFYSLDGSKLSLYKSAVGIIDINIPSIWSTMITNFNKNNLIINIFPKNANGYVKEIYVSSFKMVMESLAKYVDSDFSLSIYYMPS